MKLPLICLALLGTSSAYQAHAACYTVYGHGAIVYRSTSLPVDLSQELSETVPAKFGPGSSMVTVADETGCTSVSLAPGPLPEGISRTSPGSRDRQKAAPTRPTNSTPASLDGVFTDESMKMRSSVGAPRGGAEPAIHIGPKN
jgi:hypothetical protein